MKKLAACSIVSIVLMTFALHGPLPSALDTLPGVAKVSAAQPWDGIYRVEGTNPDGSTYGGAVEVKRFDGDLYQMTWVLDEQPGEVAMVAFAFSYDDRLVAGGINGPMAMIYKSNGDGRWALPHAAFKVLGREKLTRTKFKTLPEAVRPAARATPHGHEV